MKEFFSVQRRATYFGASFEVHAKQSSFFQPAIFSQLFL
jgi:hypothetical protein